MLNQAARQRKRGNHAEALQLRKQMQQLPSRDPYDPATAGYGTYATRRLRAGLHRAKAEAQQVKESLETFLLRLAQAGAIQGENSHNPRHQPGGAVPRLRAREPTANDQFDRNGRAGSTAKSDCGFPPTSSKTLPSLHAKRQTGTPQHATPTTRLLYRGQVSVGVPGVVNYYLLAYNVSHLGRTARVMERSLTRTLAAKHKSTARKMRRKYKSVVETEHGPRVCPTVIKQRDNGNALKWRTSVA